MNNPRRKKIKNIIELLDEIYDLINDVLEEEQDCYDNLPESLQFASKGEAMQEAIDNLEEAQNMVQEVCDYLEEAKGV